MRARGRCRAHRPNWASTGIIGCTWRHGKILFVQRLHESVPFRSSVSTWFLSALHSKLRAFTRKAPGEHATPDSVVTASRFSSSAFQA
jgi:hypothetical protein